MASSVLVRPLHLAVVCLGLACVLHLLAGAGADTELLHASVLPHDDTTLTLAGRPPASSSSTTSASTAIPDDAAPRLLDVSAAAREDVSTAPATTTAASAPPPACSSCPCVSVVVHMREAAVEDLVPQPGGINAAATTRKALLLHALPLLAVPFLPTPLLAVVVLSALTSPVRAGHLSNGTCTRGDREHATCTVYRYLPDGCVDRALPFAGLRKVCNAGSDSEACGCREGQVVGNPIQRYCHVRTLELSEGPEGLDWCVLPGHQPPIANPGAAAASGEDVCYVELEQGNHHREGYYILCPVRKCPRFPFLCCPDLQHGAAAKVVVAAA